MKITDCLKQTKAKLILGDKWLYRENDGMYVVMSGRRNEKHAELIIQTYDESEAVDCLVYHAIE
jgi:hypothetical protein